MFNNRAAIIWTTGIVESLSIDFNLDEYMKRVGEYVAGYDLDNLL